MTQTTTTHESLRTLAQRRVARLIRTSGVLGALALTTLAAGNADAAPRCKTKPAVCARMQARQAAQPSDTANAVLQRATPSPKLASASRCTTKPAVCALRRGNPQPPLVVRSPVTEPLWATVPRCTTKPAVCARLEARRQRESRPEQVAQN